MEETDSNVLDAAPVAVVKLSDACSNNGGRSGYMKAFWLLLLLGDLSDQQLAS